MAKNIVLFFASPYKKDAVAYMYKDASGEFAATCVQTNETALKYISWRLKQKGEKIASAYAFATEAVGSNDFRRLVMQMQAESYAIKPIYFDESSTIDGSFHSINIMLDVLLEEFPPDNDVTVHMDLTGGFRHSTVLLLALLQLMKYAGYKIGMVTYTNFNEKRIETVNELVDMFDLINGADDFINNGSVEILQRFFQNKKQSVQLQSILQKMEHFSACIKSCSNSTVMLKAAKDLKTAMEIYKAYLRDETASIGEQEALFARLLPVIEKAYADVFNCSTTTASIPKLISWCVEKNLLQQAVTYATELIPVYLVNSELITINNPDIIEDCRKNSKMWSNWQVHFLKNYQCKLPKIKKVEPDNKKKEIAGIDYSMLRVLIEQDYSAAELLKLVGEQNKKLSDFFNDMQQFSLKVQNDPLRVYVAINAMPLNKPIRYVVDASSPTNCSLSNYIAKRFKACKTVDSFILSCLKLAPRKLIVDLFDLHKKAVSETAPKAAADSEVFTGRAAQIIMMRKAGVINSWVDDKQLADIVNKYLQIVEYRNSFSHAFGKTGGYSGNKSLKELILDEINLITNINL